MYTKPHYSLWVAQSQYLFVVVHPFRQSQTILDKISWHISPSTPCQCWSCHKPLLSSQHWSGVEGEMCQQFCPRLSECSTDIFRSKKEYFGWLRAVIIWSEWKWSRRGMSQQSYLNELGSYSEKKIIRAGWGLLLFDQYKNVSSVGSSSVSSSLANDKLTII